MNGVADFGGTVHLPGDVMSPEHAANFPDINDGAVDHGFFGGGFDV
jgi:hypothetical protein